MRVFMIGKEFLLRKKVLGMNKMGNLQKIRLELIKQRFLFEYWRNAEQNEMKIFSLIFVGIAIPLIINIELSLTDWVTWGFIVELIVAGVIIKKRLDYYNQKQRKTREKVENLKI